MGIGARIKLAIGYNKYTHKFDSSRVQEGDMKFISENEIVKNERGRVHFCKRRNKDSPWKCRLLPFKSD